MWNRRVISWTETSFPRAWKWVSEWVSEWTNERRVQCRASEWVSGASEGVNGQARDSVLIVTWFLTTNGQYNMYVHENFSTSISTFYSLLTAISHPYPQLLLLLLRLADFFFLPFSLTNHLFLWNPSPHHPEQPLSTTSSLTAFLYLIIILVGLWRSRQNRFIILNPFSPFQNTLFNAQIMDGLDKVDPKTGQAKTNQLLQMIFSLVNHVVVSLDLRSFSFWFLFSLFLFALDGSTRCA